VPLPPRAPSRLKRPSISQMRKCRRPRALFMASKSEIRSPAYSAIFFRCSKVFVAKQPLPLIGDFLIARPGASLSFMQVHCTRLRFRIAGISARHVTGSWTSHTFPTRLARYNIPWTSLVCFLCSWCAVSVSRYAEGVSQSSGLSQVAQLVVAAPSHLELAQPDGPAISLRPSSFAWQRAESRLTDRNLQ
jgi:hypothetical protein